MGASSPLSFIVSQDVWTGHRGVLVAKCGDMWDTEGKHDQETYVTQS